MKNARISIVVFLLVAFSVGMSACEDSTSDSAVLNDQSQKAQTSEDKDESERAFENSAIELGEEFIKTLYNVDDPSFDVKKLSIKKLIDYQNNFSFYFTKKEFEDLRNNRFFTIPQEAANKLNNKISVQNIKFEKYEQDQSESNSLDFNHSFNLIFTDLEGKQVDKVKINGQMTIVNTGNGLKIDRYYDGKTLMNILYR
ncbi:hypothetical protein [Virgibacillus oceani]|uniref:NDxxF motif lipoprotein n=1 Tax=Virgibacillus oceani TaxID=1479511 RepID=A0A917HGF2_9BACI|nr:hypothetical protein [Virgibacillus oceani]GGG78860.1 hypothetical protein GCM10011398_25220 [Virgibacillus oceani]